MMVSEYYTPSGAKGAAFAERMRRARRRTRARHAVQSRRINRAENTRVYTPEEIAAINAAR